MKNRPFSVAYAVASSTATALVLSKSALLPAATKAQACKDNTLFAAAAQTKLALFAAAVTDPKGRVLEGQAQLLPDTQPADVCILTAGSIFLPSTELLLERKQLLLRSKPSWLAANSPPTCQCHDHVGAALSLQLAHPCLGTVERVCAGDVIHNDCCSSAPAISTAAVRHTGSKLAPGPNS